MEKLREKERLKYLNKKKKGQVKSVSAMNSQERRQKRKQCRLNSLKYREKNHNVRKNLARLMNETPPVSPVPSAEPSSHVNAVKNDTVALRRRRQLRNRRGILYGRIAKLRQNLKEEVKKSERYRKRYTRLNNRIKLSSHERRAKNLIKNTKLSETIKKKLIFSEIVTKQLAQSYAKLKTQRDKQAYYRNFNLDRLKKHKLMHYSQTFFKNQNYKTIKTEISNRKF